MSKKKWSVNIILLRGIGEVHYNIRMDVNDLVQLRNLLDYCCTTEKYSEEMAQLQEQIEMMIETAEMEEGD